MMDNYKILGRIGEGAHGVVLKARHTQVRGNIVSFLIVTFHRLENWLL